MSSQARAPSSAQLRALRNAADRASGCICPVFGVYAAAETVLLAALERRGWCHYADRGPGVPLITEAGRAVAAAADNASGPSAD